MLCLAPSKAEDHSQHACVAVG